MIPENPSFHAHHSPIGALASFTCGAKDANGGMGIALSRPADGQVTVGTIDADDQLTVLPLCPGMSDSERARYENNPEEFAAAPNKIAGNFSREYLWATDRFTSDETTLEIFTPAQEIPDPAGAAPRDLAFASCPCVQVRVTFRNDTKKPIHGVFSQQIAGRWSSLGHRTGGDLVGALSEDRIGFATRTPGAFSVIDFETVTGLRRNTRSKEFLLGRSAAIVIEVPPGESRTVDIALGFFVAGPATYNRSMSYYYTQHFTSLVDVLGYALDHRERYLELAAERDKTLAAAPLNDEQKFLIAHATRSYYGSTQWLWDGTQSVWVVNEGEYIMMNTFDLTVDMLFFELQFHPWTVRNELEFYVENYSFYDKVFHPQDPDTLYEGGISFTHDMGVHNHWSPAGHSSYEKAGLDRVCFSHMTCEQLTNWVLCAGVYLGQTQDTEFGRRYHRVFVECLHSLQNRDHPDPAQRNGLMSFESDRTEGGGEITTYDSLDHSLGQSRANIYLAGKMWASHVLLENFFRMRGDDALADQALHAAQLTANTLVEGYSDALGFIPAVLEGDNRSAIIPAIEALVYPYRAGLKDAVTEQGPYGAYIAVLKKHLANITNKETCLYPDGGWKLSSSADNSWMSKICLSQYVAREILGFDFGDAQHEADQAHARWQREGSTLYACSDQFTSGKAIGSLYYPRIVTNILWLDES